MKSLIARVTLIIVSLIVVAGFLGFGKPSGVPGFELSDFQNPRENPYFPLRPGSMYLYRSETSEGVETDVVRILSEKKLILGIPATVVHDSVYLDGDLVEDTLDWYAVDRSGNVWYFGEDSREIEDGQVVSTEGSWEGGVNGARPGIIMEGHPHVGDLYFQEFSAGVAEDKAEVVSLDKSVALPPGWPNLWAPVFPSGRFEPCVKTRETSRFEPTVVGWKYYAPGVGTVLELERDGNGPRVRTRLVSAVIP